MSGSYHGSSHVHSWRPTLSAKRRARARQPYASSNRRLFGVNLVQRRPAIFPTRKGGGGGGKRKRGSRGGRKSRKGGKKRGGMSARTIIDKIVPTQIWTTTIAQRFSCPQTTTAGIGQLYFIPGARVRGPSPSTIDSSGGSSYPNHHLMEMLFNGGPGSTTGTLDGKLVVHNYAHKHTLVNMSNAQTRLTRYTLVAREDIVATTGLIDAIAMINTSQWGTNDINSSQVPLTPYDYPTLTTYYKIVGVTTRTLAPGEQIVDMMSSGKRRMFNALRYCVPQETTSTYRTVSPVYKDIKNTRVYLYRMQGQLADTASAAGNVTATNPAINMTVEYRYHFKMQQPYNHATFTGGVLGMSASAGVAHFIEVDTGADVADLAD